MANSCSHEDSRLSCVECNKPICSQCMVQCPVGFRCKACVGSSIQPKGSSDRMRTAKTFGICAATGTGAAWLLPYVMLPYICCFISFFLGQFAGQQIAKIIDYRDRGSVTKIIVWGLIFGMSLSPLGLSLPFVIVSPLFALMSGHDFFGALLGVVNFLFVPACFVIGVVRATV